MIKGALNNKSETNEENELLKFKTNNFLHNFLDEPLLMLYFCATVNALSYNCEIKYCLYSFFLLFHCHMWLSWKVYMISICYSGRL